MDYAAAAANMANIAGASAVHHPHHPHAAAADHHAHLYGLAHHPSAAAAPPGPPPAHPQHHLLGQPPQNPKRNADSAGLDSYGGASSDEDGSMVDVKPPLSSNSSGDRLPSGGGAGRGQGAKGSQSANDSAASAKKTKGRVKIKMEFIDNKLRRYTTFSKRKTGIMKKVSEKEQADMFCGRVRHIHTRIFYKRRKCRIKKERKKGRKPRYGYLLSYGKSQVFRFLSFSFRPL